MILEIEETGTIVVLRLSGKRNLKNIQEDRPEWDFANDAGLQRLLETGGKKFVLDVRRAEVDSIVIATLCAMLEQIGKAGGELKVVAEEKQRWCFKAGHLELIETCENLEKALGRFKPEP